MSNAALNPSGYSGEESVMSKNSTEKDRRFGQVSRRRFVQGIAATGMVAALRGTAWPAFGETVSHTSSILTGNHFELTIDSMPVNFAGRHAMATAINGSVPGPTLKWREGDNVTIAVTNRLKETTSIHWHGVRLPADMDGVPGVSFAGIPAGETFVYRIPVEQNGTYWYHSHSGFQEQTGLYAALIIEPRDKDPVEFDREYVVLLSDWTDTNPLSVYRNLKMSSDYYNYHRTTLPNFVSESNEKGFGATLSARLKLARMNMSPSDISDVSGATYTYLLNGNAPNTNWTGLFQPSEKVRLRFINGSAMTLLDVRIPGLPMTVVQADGNDVDPVVVDEFRIGVAETYDVIVQPREDTAYSIFAQAADRTGFARGTLAPRLGMTAEVPPMDPRPVRTMMDMGMKMGAMSGMASMDMSGMDGAKPSGMTGMDMGKAKDGAMPLKEAGAPADAGKDNMAGMKMGAGIMGSSTGITPFPQPGPNTMPIMSSSEMAQMSAKLEPSNPVKLRVGPQVVQVTAEPRALLNDPGAGLSGNGRRVLTYADLRARYRGVDGRPPTREIELHLTGNMERFIWGINGQKFSGAEPIEMKLGERLRIVFINDSMMEHPMHLHGLWSELENGNGEFNPYKHTLTVKPAERVSFLVSADTPGRWAFHCHLIYHLKAGMFREVVVS
jgi:CopA family copper-resistance protein